MTEHEMLARMVPPGTRRPGKWRDGVIQVHVTRACDKSCYACTQGSNLGGKVEFMSPDMFQLAVESLGFPNADAYFGVVGVFGGNPALSPHFHEYCSVLRRLVPREQRGLWCNNPMTLDKAQDMAATFDPGVSNLNVHLDPRAFELFKLGWPQCHPVGLHGDSRHAPVHLAMKDVLRKECPLSHNCHTMSHKSGCNCASGQGANSCYICHGEGTVPDDDRIRELISGCDINQHWSAMLGVFRGELRAWFCEVAGAQSMLHQHDPSYPDTGVKVKVQDGRVVCGYDYVNNDLAPDGEVLPSQWWQWSMQRFVKQVNKHCFECGVPLRGYGELSQTEGGREQTSATHESVFKPKRKGRAVQVVTNLHQLGLGRIRKVNHYLQNASL